MNSPTFRAAVVRTPNGPDSIEIIDLPVTEPGPGEVRVAVAAAPVNPTDLGVTGGFFHQMGMINQPSHTGLGWDFAGTVVAAGPGVDLAVGTRVAGVVLGFDRDFGTYAEQLVVPAADLAVVPDDLDLIAASTVPLAALSAAQIVDLLGDAPADHNRVLVAGAAGAIGANVAALAPERGWRVTGLARAEDEPFVRGLGADFRTEAEPGWDAVVDTTSEQVWSLHPVRDGGSFVGVRPNLTPAAERGITVHTLMVQSDGARLSQLLARAASGELPTRVHAVLPLTGAAEAHRAMTKGGTRGRYVLQPQIVQDPASLGREYRNRMEGSDVPPSGNPVVPDTDVPVTVINTMSVPAAQRDLFLQRWLDSAQYMAAASGFRRTRMFQAVDEAAEAVFVNVGDWDSAAALREALGTPEWRELTLRIQNDVDLTARPMIFHLALELGPGDVLSR
ncbi:zinc-binding dehydrogenase [Nocardia sp. NPDC052001]|uniref:zinc-binding dehydrogenase n=1 Tax=Nocardia sp. NPDC052001 TaxID=3154853 RepID=UPI003434F4AB